MEGMFALDWLDLRFIEPAVILVAFFAIIGVAPPPMFNPESYCESADSGMLPWC